MFSKCCKIVLSATISQDVGWFYPIKAHNLPKSSSFLVMGKKSNNIWHLHLTMTAQELNIIVGGMVASRRLKDGKKGRGGKEEEGRRKSNSTNLNCRYNGREIWALPPLPRNDISCRSHHCLGWDVTIWHDHALLRGVLLNPCPYVGGPR